MVSIMDQGSISTNACAPTTADYEENVKVFGKTRLYLPFTPSMAFCNLKILSMIKPLS